MIIVIVGPTATGKTRLSLELAKKYNAEIINADAVQIYKEVNIGSAKIKDYEGVPHHLINIKSLDETYTIYDFQKDGRKLLDKLISENKNIIVVGGSGLYIKALLYDYKLENENPKNTDYENLSNEELKNMVDKIYKDNNIHVNNRKRLIRFLTYYNNTGSFIESKQEKDNKLYDFIMIGLKSNREILYDKINKRVEDMFEEGLLIEAEELYNKGYKNLSNIIGYKELMKYFENEISLEEAKELIKQNTRNYAKRQMTWFNHQEKDINWFDVDYGDFSKTIEGIKNYISKNNCWSD